MGEKKGFFGKLISGLTKTRDNLKSGIDSLFSGFSEIDEDFYEELLKTSGKRLRSRKLRKSQYAASF